MKFFLNCSFALLMTAGTGAALAAGDSSSDIRDQPADPAMDGIKSAIEKSDWPRARELARAGVDRNPSSAVHHNLYAYALRKGANPEMSLVFKHYNEALRLDPKHRGAQEYLGEAYLMVGNLPKAKEQLQTLNKLCFFSCPEYAMLKKAIADYESKPNK